MVSRGTSASSAADQDRELAWGWAAEPARLDRPLWPVVLSAAKLLSSDQLQRVHRCPGKDGRCGWLFLDTSKAGRRQWCSTQGCGNRAKARRHYARSRTARRWPGEPR